MEQAHSKGRGFAFVASENSVSLFAAFFLLTLVARKTLTDYEVEHCV